MIGTDTRARPRAHADVAAATSFASCSSTARQSQTARRVRSSVFKRATDELASRADGVFLLSQRSRPNGRDFGPGRGSSWFATQCRHRRAGYGQQAPGRDDSPIILSVARLIPGKGGAELVRALPRVLAQTTCRLRLVGAGPEKGRLRALAVELGVDDSVELPGYLEGSDLANAYERAAVFALPTSLEEGFPLSILEAMAAACP